MKRRRRKRRSIEEKESNPEQGWFMGIAGFGQRLESAFGNALVEVEECRDNRRGGSDPSGFVCFRWEGVARGDQRGSLVGMLGEMGDLLLVESAQHFPFFFLWISAREAAKGFSEEDGFIIAVRFDKSRREGSCRFDKLWRVQHDESLKR